jgi:hypothetical protein
MVYCVVSVGKGQRNELCFKTAYRNCESKYANVTSSKVRFSLKLFQNVQLEEKRYSHSLPISIRNSDDLQSLLNIKSQSP